MNARLSAVPARVVPQDANVDDHAVARAISRARQTLRAAGRMRPFRRRETVLAVGARSDSVLLIESGVMKVLLPTDGGLDVVVGLYGPGELLGELGVLYSRPRSATVLGHRAGIATFVAASTFRDLVNRDRDVRVLLDVTQRGRLHNADRRQRALATMDVRARVIAQLLEWARLCGEQTEDGLVVRGLSHRDLAGAVLASEKHVDAVLHELRRAGLVRTRRLCFILADPGRLRSNLAMPRKSGRTPRG